MVDIGIGTVTSPIAINRPTSANTNSSSAVHRLSTSPFVLDVSDNIPTSSPVTNTSPPSPTHSVGSGISLRNEKMVHTSIIPAHNSQLAFLCFNPDGILTNN